MGTPLLLHVKVCLQVLESMSAYVKKFVWSGLLQRELSCAVSDKLPQVMSTEAALVGSRDYESLKVKKVWGCEVEV